MRIGKVHTLVLLLGLLLSFLLGPSPAQSGIIASGGWYVLLDDGKIYQLMRPAAGMADFITQTPFALTEPTYFLTGSSSDFGLVTESGHLWWYYRGGQGWVDYGYPMGQMTSAQSTTWGELKTQFR